MKKTIKKSIKKEEDRWINVHSDNECAKYGVYRAKAYEGRDESVWKRSKNERRILKNLPRIKDTSHFPFVGVKHIPVRGKLIIYLYKNKKFSKTVISIECWQHEISEILCKYVSKNNQNLVMKYSFNGRTYDPKERPSWISL